MTTTSMLSKTLYLIITAIKRPCRISISFQSQWRPSHSWTYTIQAAFILLYTEPVLNYGSLHVPWRTRSNELSPPSSVGVLEPRCDRMDDHTSLVVVEPKRRLNVKASSAMFFRHALYVCPSTASIATWDELVSRLARDSC